MLNRIVVKFREEDNNHDGWVFPKVLENLKKLGKKMNRKDFLVTNTPMFDDELYGEENSVGNVVGEKITVICDTMFNNLVMKEIQKGVEMGFRS